MQLGTIKTYKAVRGFGFIAVDAGKDLFFHVTETTALDAIEPGMRVCFEIGTGRRDGKPRAMRVREA
jgi:cold shock CspA family protein